MARTGTALILLFVAGCASSELKLDPKKAREYYREGVEAGDQGRFREAIEAFTESLRYHPSYAVAYYSRAWSWLQLRKSGETSIPTRQLIDRALSDYGSAISANPTFSDAYFSRAMIHLSRAQYRGAVADLLVCCRYSPRDVEPHLLLAQIYETRFEGKTVLAMNHYEQYAELGGTDEDAIAKAKAWRSLQEQPKAGPVPSKDDEARAKELHDRFKLLFSQERESEAVAAIGELVEKYGHTRYYKDREVALGALWRSLKGDDESP